MDNNYQDGLDFIYNDAGEIWCEICEVWSDPVECDCECQ
jgi:hypothetical protein